MISQQFDLHLDPTQAPSDHGGVTPPVATRLLSRGAERLLDALRWYSVRFKRVYPGEGKLAELLHLTLRQIRRLVRELRELGIVTVLRYGRAAAEFLFHSEAIKKQNVLSKSYRCPGGDRSKSHRSDPYPYSLLEPVSTPEPAAPPTPSPEEAAAAGSPVPKMGCPDTDHAPAPTLGMSEKEFRLIQKRAAELGMGMPDRRMAAKVRGLFPALPITDVIPILVRFDCQQSVGLWTAKSAEDFENESKLQRSGLKKPPGMSKRAREEEERRRSDEKIDQLWERMQDAKRRA